MTQRVGGFLTHAKVFQLKTQIELQHFAQYVLSHSKSMNVRGAATRSAGIYLAVLGNHNHKLTGAQILIAGLHTSMSTPI